jgi:hypothetical protein
VTSPNSQDTTGVPSTDRPTGAPPDCSSKSQSPWRKPSTMVSLAVACLIPIVIGARISYVLRIPLVLASLYHMSSLPIGFATAFLAIAYVFLYACDGLLLLHGLQRDWKWGLPPSRTVRSIVAIFLGLAVCGFLFNSYQVSQFVSSSR